MVSSNRFEKVADFEEYYSRLPVDKIMGQIPKVAAIKKLRCSDKEPFKTQSTKVNNLARGLYSTVIAAIEEMDKEEQTAEAVA